MRLIIPFTAAAVIFTGYACGPSNQDSPEQQTISSDAFIEAYYQLRIKALRLGPERTIDVQTRDSILSEQGVTAEDLESFVQVWGENGEVMQEVWAKVDSLVRQARVEASDDDYEDETVRPDTGIVPPPGGGNP